MPILALLFYQNSGQKDTSYESAAAVLTYARAVLGLKRVVAPDNARSLAVVFRGYVANQQIQIGTHRWMTELCIETRSLQQQWDQLESLGKTVIWIAVNGKAEAIMGIADAVKPLSVSAIRSLQKLGLEVVMLTGDNRQAAEVIVRSVVTNALRLRNFHPKVAGR